VSIAALVMLCLVIFGSSSLIAMFVARCIAVGTGPSHD
jgi:hypothetical protein